jgi:hypothetical protein
VQLNAPLLVGIVLVLALAGLAFAASRARQRTRRQREEIALADAQPRVSARLERMRRRGGPLDATTITDTGAESLTTDPLVAPDADASEVPGRAAATGYEEQEIEEVSLERLRASTAAPLRRGAPPVAWAPDRTETDADARLGVTEEPDSAGYEEAERSAALTSDEEDAIHARLAAMRGGTTRRRDAESNADADLGAVQPAGADAMHADDAAIPAPGSAPRSRPRDPYAGYEDPFPEEELPASTLLTNVEEPLRVAPDPQLAAATTGGPAAAPLEPLPKPMLGDTEEVEGQPFYGVEARDRAPVGPTADVEPAGQPDTASVDEAPVTAPEPERGRRRVRRGRPAREATEGSRLRRGRGDWDQDEARPARAPSPERARAQLRRDASAAVLLFALAAGLAFAGGVARAAPPAPPSAPPAAASPAR